MVKFLQKIADTPNKIDKVLNSNFMQTGLALSKGMNALKPTDPNLSEEDRKKQGFKNIVVSGLGSAAINF